MTYNNKYNALDKIIASFRSKEIKKNINLKNKKILDFGCGSNFRELKERYRECANVSLVDKIGDNFNNQDNFNFIHFDGNISKLDKILPNKYYDHIFLLAVVEHLDHPENILNILKKKLTNNGFIFLTAPGKKSKWILEFMAYRLKIINAELVKEHKRYYNLDEYNKLSALTNMNIIKFYFFELGLNTVCLLK
tara:strand:- start:1326 stop:1904 length:579 start_codon:yes stop_codon:yes gene_type:complete